MLLNVSLIPHLAVPSQRIVFFFFFNKKLLSGCLFDLTDLTKPCMRGYSLIVGTEGIEGYVSGCVILSLYVLSVWGVWLYIDTVCGFLVYKMCMCICVRY